ncbi:hypothetical protein PHAVU_009G105800 [Phaseolus vulgaris]|uniref:Acetyl xylan esterase domain-containing protein n=2 Tax=Phaseolus vulgaris TaxID=3885 RepID=V7AY81_PHAVU|nr:hypothetical protein PHAVU_009G105800g [Phaseolus vulgaris]ESW09166.1 hypothetical protein PHAVU_009G105800g [Phaseolus vulgaris]
MAQKEALQEAHAKLRSKFYKVLRSHREEERDSLPIRILHAERVVNPFATCPPTKEEALSKLKFTEVMESCPKADIENLEELLEEEEELCLYISQYWDIPEEEEEEDQETLPEWKTNRRIPLLIWKLKESDKQRKRPAVIFLHGLDQNKEDLRPWLKAYASRGYIAISMDTIHHGERAKSVSAFRNGLVVAWALGETMPFIYDTAYDLIKLADYLTAKREDIDPSRIGITGIGLGGMHAWFAAFADTRYAVAVPLVGVQEFRWIIDNEKWMDQYDSVKHFFDVARHNLSKDVIDKEAVEKAWERIAPGLTSEFDSPNSIPAIAPRPLLIINGAEDRRCPVASLEVPRSKAIEAYEAFQCSDHFKV